MCKCQCRREFAPAARDRSSRDAEAPIYSIESDDGGHERFIESTQAVRCEESRSAAHPSSKTALESDGSPPTGVSLASERPWRAGDRSAPPGGAQTSPRLWNRGTKGGRAEGSARLRLEWAPGGVEPPTLTLISQTNRTSKYGIEAASLRPWDDAKFFEIDRLPFFRDCVDFD